MTLSRATDLFSGAFAQQTAQQPLPQIVWKSSFNIYLIGLVGFALVCALGWNYSIAARSSRVSRGRRTVGFVLKAIAIALILICLLEPMVQKTRPRPRANVMVVLIDQSESMQVRAFGTGDSADSDSRIELAQRVFASDSDVTSKLDDVFDVRTYSFAETLSQVSSIDSLVSDGKSSSLAKALSTVHNRLRHRPVAGVLLMTDGNATDTIGKTISPAEFEMPIYPVARFDNRQFSDLRIADTAVAQSNFETAPTTVSITVENDSDQTRSVIVDLVEPSNFQSTSSQSAAEDPIGSQQISIDAGGTGRVKFRFRPAESGVNFYEAIIRDADDQREFTNKNNRRPVVIDRDQGPYRVLYVSGRPNWDYKFLRRSLDGDTEVQLVGLLRIANKKPKFSFRGGASGDTNPLFAGLGKDEEEIALQYDEPVMVRLGVKESEELSDGFPRTDEELFGYDALILDDIGADFFTQDQLLSLRKFVSVRGGGLMVLGGAESLRRRDLRSTTLGELMPVYPPGIETAFSSEVDSTGWRFDLTREGWLAPWMRLREKELADRDRLAKLPDFQTVNIIGRPKPGATVLATSIDKQDNLQPTIVTQNFGAGRTAILSIGDLWRSAMQSGSARDDKSKQQSDDLEQTWRQLVRWLVGDVPKRVEMNLVESSDPSQANAISVMVRDESFQPMDNAEIELSVTPSDGEPLKLRMNPDANKPGLYRAEYWSEDSGTYLAEVQVKSADGEVVGQDQSGWAVDLLASEWSKLRTNEQLLRDIAVQTGGEVVDPDELPEFIERLSSKPVPVTETYMTPLWHQSWIMILAMGCLCAEWWLRRTGGLA